MHACMQGVKWLTPLLIKLMFSCRSRQTYLANVLIGCSNPPQGEIIQSKLQQDKFVKIKLSTEEHLFYHHFMSAGATQKPESLQLYCCLLLSFTCLQDHGSKKKVSDTNMNETLFQVMRGCGTQTNWFLHNYQSLTHCISFFGRQVQHTSTIDWRLSREDGAEIIWKFGQNLFSFWWQTLYLAPQTRCNSLWWRW